MKFLLLFTIVVCSTVYGTCSPSDSLARQKKDSTILKKHEGWKFSSTQSLNGSQTSFVNWNSGGRTNFSMLGSVVSSAYLRKKRLKWENDINLALGGVKYFDKKEIPIQKTDDRIDLSSNLGYNLIKDYYFSLNTGFKTQALDGYKYPNDSLRISSFMAPGYVNLALGVDYIKGESFTVFVSPFAPKMTFVQVQQLANNGDFGVQPATIDSAGNIVVPGRNFRGEFGSYVKLKFKRNVAKNIDLNTKLELFSNYNNNPENIDVNAEAIFNFKVNAWFSANLQMNLVYDDDIIIQLPDGTRGPRTQFKSIVGLGLSYKMVS